MICKDCEHFLHRNPKIYDDICTIDMCHIEPESYYTIKECSHYSKKKESNIIEKSIATKTPAVIIDELFTVLHKCWNQQEIVMNKNNSESDIAEASIKAQELNAKRNKLIRALDEILGYSEITLTEKTYCQDDKNNE